MPIFSSGYPEKTSNSDEDRFLISDSIDSNKIKGTKWSTIKSSIQSYVEGFTDWITTSMLKDGAVASDKNKVTIGFRAEKTTPQSIPTLTSTLVTWQQVVYDFGGNFSNNGFTAPFDGLYHFSTRLGDFTTSSRTFGSILVNGNEAARSDDVTGRAISLSVALPLKEDDTVTVQIRHQEAGSSNTASAPYAIWFEGYLVGLVDED